MIKGSQDLRIVNLLINLTRQKFLFFLDPQLTDITVQTLVAQQCPEPKMSDPSDPPAFGGKYPNKSISNI